MRWKHNIILPTKDSTLVALHVSRTGDTPCLWLLERRAAKTLRLPFHLDGRLERIQPFADYCFDAVLPYASGVSVVRYDSPCAKVMCLASDGSALWDGELQDADSRHWGIVEKDEHSLFMAYSSRNLHDAFQKAHVVKINTAAKGQPAEPVFTVPEEEYSCVQVLVPMAERFALCTRNQGAGVNFHIIDYEGNSLSNGSFAAHPHSRWAIPLCHVPLATGENLLGGWQETVPGVRLPWLARFDADFDVLYGTALPATNGETAVARLSRAPDGELYALCPPWSIYRLSSRGFPTHVWEVPQNLRTNSITGIYGVDDGACLITGSSLVRNGPNHAKAVWLAAVDGAEFAAL